MNVYFVDAGVLDVVVDQIDYMYIYGREQVCGLVTAPSHARARYTFWKANRRDLPDGLTETPLSAKIVYRQVTDRDEGILDANDDYWAYTCPEHWGMRCDPEVNHPEEFDEGSDLR